MAWFVFLTSRHRQQSNRTEYLMYMPDNVLTLNPLWAHPYLQITKYFCVSHINKIHTGLCGPNYRKVLISGLIYIFLFEISFLLCFRDAPLYSPSTGHLPGSCQGSINFGRSQKTACHPACGVDADATARRSVGLAAIRTNRQNTVIDRFRNGVEELCGLGNRTTKKPCSRVGRNAMV